MNGHLIETVEEYRELRGDGNHWLYDKSMTVEGTFTGGSYQGQLCDETELNGDLAGKTLTIDMDGTGGSLVKTTDSTSWHVAGESNFHRNDRGLNRMAYGTVDIPELSEWAGWEGEGSIGQHSWSRHTNE